MSDQFTYIYCTLYFCRGFAIPLWLPLLAFVPFEIHSNRAKNVNLLPPRMQRIGYVAAVGISLYKI